MTLGGRGCTGAGTGEGCCISEAIPSLSSNLGIGIGDTGGATGAGGIIGGGATATGEGIIGAGWGVIGAGGGATATGGGVLLPTVLVVSAKMSS